MFRESIWWGLSFFLLPFMDIVFLCVRFREAWPSVRTMLVGVFLMISPVLFTARIPDTPVRETLIGKWSSVAHRKPSLPMPEAERSALVIQSVITYHDKMLVQGADEVTRILADDTEGSKHQRFILKLASGRTLLVAHNTDVGQRVENLQVGDIVGFYGESAENNEGGVVHWTHRDPKGIHPNGWLKVKGRTYQ